MASKYELRILMGKLSRLEREASKLREEVSKVLHYIIELYEKGETK